MPTESAYLDGARLRDDPKGWLFRTAPGRTGQLTARAMSQTDVYRMIGRRARDAGIATRIGCHSFRATGITEYLRNGGKLEVAVASLGTCHGTVSRASSPTREADQAEEQPRALTGERQRLPPACEGPKVQSPKGPKTD